jgi:hypothetical protein
MRRSEHHTINMVPHHNNQALTQMHLRMHATILSPLVASVDSMISLPLLDLLEEGEQVICLSTYLEQPSVEAAVGALHFQSHHEATTLSSQ